MLIFSPQEYSFLLLIFIQWQFDRETEHWWENDSLIKPIHFWAKNDGLYYEFDGLLGVKEMTDGFEKIEL